MTKGPLPDFIVVGAQKCGTTTLYEDLRKHSKIRIADKESSALLGETTDEANLRQRYAEAFQNRPPSATLIGEVATTYTMLPHHPEAAGNACQLVPNAKVIYIVREPVSRVISHHHHDFGLGLVGPDIDAAVRSHPPLLDNSRYATQIRPWFDAFGPSSVRVVRFEDYVADRATGAAELFEFLDLTSEDLGAIEVVHNAAESKRIAVGWRNSISQNEFYRRRIRPLISESMRGRLTSLILKRAPERPAPPSPQTVDYIVDQLWPEVDELARLLNTDPWWDRQQVVDGWHSHWDTM